MRLAESTGPKNRHLGTIAQLLYLRNEGTYRQSKEKRRRKKLEITGQKYNGLP